MWGLVYLIVNIFWYWLSDIHNKLDAISKHFIIEQKCPRNLSQQHKHEGQEQKTSIFLPPMDLVRHRRFQWAEPISRDQRRSCRGFD